MREELQDLIERICAVEPMIDSSQSTSWKALREAETLSDLSIVLEIREFLSGKTKKEQRRAAYFVLGKIGKNNQSHECAQALISFIRKEKDKYALAALLDYLADIWKPRELDLSPVYELLDDSRWLVRRSAIGSLRNTESDEAEAHILARLEKVEDPYDVVSFHATLNSIGTRRAIPLLERSFNSRKRDIKLSAELAISAINQRTLALNDLEQADPSSSR